jgi:hypothetical protein
MYLHPSLAQLIVNERREAFDRAACRHRLVRGAGPRRNRRAARDAR